MAPEGKSLSYPWCGSERWLFLLSWGMPCLFCGLLASGNMLKCSRLCLVICTTPRLTSISFRSLHSPESMICLGVPKALIWLRQTQSKGNGKSASLSSSYSSSPAMLCYLTYSSKCQSLITLGTYSFWLQHVWLPFCYSSDLSLPYGIRLSITPAGLGRLSHLPTSIRTDSMETEFLMPWSTSKIK